MKDILKTITETTLTASEVEGADDQITYYPIPEKVTTFDRVTPENATRVFLRNCKNKKIYKNRIIVVSKIEQTSKTYAISIKDFIKAATEINSGEDPEQWRADE